MGCRRSVICSFTVLGGVYCAGGVLGVQSGRASGSQVLVERTADALHERRLGGYQAAPTAVRGSSRARVGPWTGLGMGRQRRKMRGERILTGRRRKQATGAQRHPLAKHALNKKRSFDMFSAQQRGGASLQSLRHVLAEHDARVVTACTWPQGATQPRAIEDHIASVSSAMDCSALSSPCSCPCHAPPMAASTPPLLIPLLHVQGLLHVRP